MQVVDREARRYDGWTIFFHWLTFLLVVLQFAGAWTIDDFPRGPLRVNARSVHIMIGALLALILIGRLSWRMTRGRRLPPADGPAMHAVAQATHWGLYLALLGMVGVGGFLVWARGDSLFNLVAIPPFAPHEPGIRREAQELHGNIGWVIIGLAGLHATAALAHRALWRDGVLARMLPHGSPSVVTVTRRPTGAAGQD